MIRNNGSPDQTEIPKKSKNNLSFYQALRYFFYLGGSICITFILRIYYMFTDLLTLLSYCVKRFYLSAEGIFPEGPTLRRFIGIFGFDEVSLEFIERSTVFYSFFYYLSFQLFFLPGDGEVIFPLLLLLSFLSWLIDLFIFIYCSA